MDSAAPRPVERRVAPPAAGAPPTRKGVAALGLLIALALGLAVERTGGSHITWLYVVGLAFGGVLFHSRFGFTSAWRQLASVGQGAALRAHMLMLAAGCLLFAPLLAHGTGLSGTPLHPSVSPLGVSVVVGAFLFGIGMQLGGSCASGTLFTIGSGQTAIVLTLAGFIGGSVLGAWNFDFWTKTMPTGPAVSLADSSLGYGGALAVSLLAMALIVALTLLIERRRRPPAMDKPPQAHGVARVIRGAWPLWVGAVLLAALNAITLWISGGPWGITSAFALWGSKAADAIGLHASSWAYWTAPKNAAALHAPVLADRTSVMDFGVMVGALVASAVAGTFVLHRNVPWKLAVGAVIGGILMGYGARISYGCNIGAYFAGIASFSLHGWLWGVMALVGTFAGLRLRPLFGLTNPKPTDSVC